MTGSGEGPADEPTPRPSGRPRGGQVAVGVGANTTTATHSLVARRRRPVRP